MTPDPGTNGDVPENVRQTLAAERTRLTELRQSVAGDLGDSSEARSLSEPADVDQHPADHASETQYREQEQSVVESFDERLADVEAALEKLDQGTYGSCEACGRPIGRERLEALPATRFCVDDAALASAEASPGATRTTSPLEAGERAI